MASEKGPAKENALKLELKDLRDVIFVEDMDHNLTYVSPSVFSLFGYSVEEAKNLKKKDFMTPDSLERALASFQKFSSLSEEEDVDIPLMEYEYVRKDGSAFWGELKVTFLRDSDGRLVGSQGILRNIDARKKMEEHLRQSELRCRTLFELSPQPIAVTHLASGRLVDVNEKFCEITQYAKDELIGRRTTELGFYSEEDRNRYLKELQESGEVRGLEMDFRSKDGSVLNSQMFARLIRFENETHVLNVFHDKTHEKRLEHQFLQAQKMESVGNLAGGIAHDFNNLLMGIEGNVSLMLLDIEEDHPHRAMLNDVEKHVKSCAELTRQLLGYARKGKYEVAPLDLNELIEETANSFQRARKQIRVHKELASNLLPVEGDAVQIRQMLYNLYVNAADAMPRGGDLFLKSFNVAYKDMFGRAYKPKKNEYVSVEVVDTGVGMDENALEHLFEPFFTTKEKGKGTGLGLASVYGIVKGHGGYIDVESRQGEGAAFAVYLPASHHRPKKPAQDVQKVFNANYTVLLVDDEEGVLEVETKILEKMGFTVFKAENGQDALELYRAKSAAIDLVILDLIMPGMDGGAVYDRIKELSPDAKVLLSSGYSADGRVSEILNRGCSGFIQKPFSISELSQKIGALFKKE